VISPLRRPSSLDRFLYFLNRSDSNPMIRILSTLAASVFALLAASCCCTGEQKAPGLRPLPQFQEIQSAPAPEVHYSK
jgi:hypothetical protein